MDKSEILRAVRSHGLRARWTEYDDCTLVALDYGAIEPIDGGFVVYHDSDSPCDDNFPHATLSAAIADYLARVDESDGCDDYGPEDEPDPPDMYEYSYISELDY